MFPLGILCQVNASISDLLLNFDGANNTNLFIDDSSYHHTIVTVGTPIQFDGKGVFDGSGYIYTDTLPAFLDKDFVITGKFSIPNYPLSYYYQYTIFGFYRGVEILDPICLSIGPGISTNYKKLYINAITPDLERLFLTHQTDVSLNDEHTFKVQRSNGVIRLFLDGIEAASTIVTSKSLSVAESRFCVGHGGDYADPFVGIIDELNVSIAS